MSRTDLLPIEREYLVKERANLLDRLAFVEERLGLARSVSNRATRQQADYEARVRQRLRANDSRSERGS